MPLNVKKVLSYPVFIKTTNDEYVNANNIMRIRQVNNNTFTIETVEGSSFVSTHTINKKEAGKILDCNI